MGKEGVIGWGGVEGWGEMQTIITITIKKIKKKKKNKNKKEWPELTAPFSACFLPVEHLRSTGLFLLCPVLLSFTTSEQAGFLLLQFP